MTSACGQGQLYPRFTYYKRQFTRKDALKESTATLETKMAIIDCTNETLHFIEIQLTVSIQATNTKKGQ